MSRHVPGNFLPGCGLTRVVWLGAASAPLLLSGCMRDTVSPFEPGGRAPVANVSSTAAISLGSQSASPGSGLSTRSAGASATEWTNLGGRITPEEFARVAELRLRVDGTVEIEVNPPFESYYCIEKKASQWYFWTSSACHWSGLGSHGLMGYRGHLRMEFRVLKEDGTNGMVPVFGPDSTGAYSLGLATPGQVQMRRYGLGGEAAWTGHPTIPMYTFSDGRTVTLEMVPKTGAQLVMKCMMGQTEIGRGTNIQVQVERASTLECRADLDPSDGAAELVVPEWSAKDIAGHLIPGPRGDVKWGGTMVVNTTITVSGKVNNEPVTATATVSIMERGWSGQITYLSEPLAEPVGMPQLEYPPTLPAPGDVAHGVFGQYQGAIPSVGPEMVNSGPNEGWWYIPQLPAFSGAHWMRINKALYPGDPFYRAQRGGGNKCDKRQLDHAREFTISHERAHYEVDRRVYEDEMPMLLESALLYDPHGIVPEKDFDEKMVRPFFGRREQLHREVDASVLEWSCSEFHDLPRNGG